MNAALLLDEGKLIKKEIKDHTLLITPTNYPLLNWSSSRPLSLHEKYKSQSNLGIRPLGSSCLPLKSNYCSKLNNVLNVLTNNNIFTHSTYLIGLNITNVDNKLDSKIPYNQR